MKPAFAALQPRHLLVRQTNWIGDAVMTTPALAALRAHFPHSRIVVLANPLVAELFVHHPHVDAVQRYEKQGCHGGAAGLWRLGRELRRQGFEAALLLQNAFEAALIARLAGIPWRAGYRTDGRGLLLSHGVARTAADKRRHHTDYYLELLRRLGLNAPAAPLLLACTSAEQDAARTLLAGQRPVAINPGAAYGSAKRWLPERFAAVADALADRYGVPIVLTGGPNEQAIGADIAAAMRSPVQNLIGRTSVRQLMALLQQCRLLVTNDSGPMHVAAAFGVPLVAVFGSTDHRTTSPLAANVRIVRQAVDCAPCLRRQCPTDHRCMTAISAEMVVAAACELLDGLSGEGAA
ncbi:MAG: lipopolysaccharide heptosyltransferase II [Desulfuromonas sp.]